MHIGEDTANYTAIPWARTHGGENRESTRSKTTHPRFCFLLWLRFCSCFDRKSFIYRGKENPRGGSFYIADIVRGQKERELLEWRREARMEGAGGSSSREAQISIAAFSMFPGFRFSPTDEELISHYLKKKLEGCERSVEVISEVEICRHEPWDLPEKSVIRSENEWFFFSARGRKYPNGTQSRRATELGYWKATGKERNVKAGSRVIGTKRTLVFHLGRAPKGERTEWIMHEYCMAGKSQDDPVICRLRRNTEFRLGDTSNRASSSQRQLSAVDDRNRVTSEGGVDQTNVSEGDKPVEGFARRCPSSYDSHSVEQIDSASESNQNVQNEGIVAESSIHQKDTGDEEDYFADILKDEIIKLDECFVPTVEPQLLPPPPPAALPMESGQLEVKSEAQEPIEAFSSQVRRFSTTASQRATQDQPPSTTSASEGLGLDKEYRADEDEEWRRFQGLPTCLISTIMAGKTLGRRATSAVLLMVIVVGLHVLLQGGCPAKWFSCR